MDKLSIPSSPCWYLFQNWCYQHLPVSLTSAFVTQMLVTFFLTDWLPRFEMLCVFYWLILENFLFLSQDVIGRSYSLQAGAVGWSLQLSLWGLQKCSEKLIQFLWCFLWIFKAEANWNYSKPQAKELARLYGEQVSEIASSYLSLWFHKICYIKKRKFFPCHFVCLSSTF